MKEVAILLDAGNNCRYAMTLDEVWVIKHALEQNLHKILVERAEKNNNLTKEEKALSELIDFFKSAASEHDCQCW